MPYPSRIEPERIGEQALAVVEVAGWEHWSLREVAAALGVTPNALYRHVDGRRGLLVAIGGAATQALDQALARKSRQADDEPLARVVELAERYVAFAVRRPHAYAAFVHAKPDLADPAVAPWLALWIRVRATVDLAVPASTDAAAFALWALLHGRVALAEGPARHAAPDRGLEAAVRVLIDGFGRADPIPSPLPSILQTGSSTGPA